MKCNKYVLNFLFIALNFTGLLAYKPFKAYFRCDMKIINDIVAFIVEMVMLVALCIAGYELATKPFLKYTLAIVLPAVVIIIWSIWAAPKAKRRIRFPWLSVFKITLFFITAVLLFVTGHHVAAIVFAVVGWFNEINTPVIK